MLWLFFAAAPHPVIFLIIGSLFFIVPRPAPRLRGQRAWHAHCVGATTAVRGKAAALALTVSEGE